MRRILLLVTDLEVGGTPAVVRELSTRLKRQAGAEVHVVCLGRFGPVAGQIQQRGLAVTALNAAGFWDLGVLLRLPGLMRRGGFDTVLSFLIHANVAAALMSLVCPWARYIQCIQTTQARPRWHWWLQGLIQARAEGIVVPSESVCRAAIERAGIPADRIRLIPNAVDPGQFAGLMGVDPHIVPFPVGFIGRLDPVKRVCDLVEAAAALRGRVHLHVFGDGPQRRAIESQVRAMSLDPCVTLHGMVSHPRQALEQIGMLVLPSEAEGLPMVLLEAMAARVPVVATDIGGIRDVIEDGRTGLLVPCRRPELLARAIARLIDDAGLRQSLIEQAAAEVARRFTWEQVMPRYRQLLGL